MDSLFAVMVGGALGSAGRYAVGQAVMARVSAGFPWHTLIVNLAGGLAMGLLAGWLVRGGGEIWRLLLGVGVLGGFTTFSAFGLETFLMIERGEPALALAYVAASVMGAVVLTGVGFFLVRSL